MMSSIAKFAIAALIGGVAIGALAATSVPHMQVASADSSVGGGDPPAAAMGPDQAYGQGATTPDSPPPMAPLPDDRTGDQMADAPADDAGVNNQAAPDDAGEDAAAPVDDRAAQAADAAREAADDARAAEAAPQDAPAR